MRIDPPSTAILASRDALLLGLIRRRDELIRLVSAGDGAGEFRTHQAMIDAGTIAANDWRGFSLQISGGKIAWFQRQSCLNVDCRGQSLTIEMMDGIILEMMLQRRESFVSFGDTW